jgi:uncharacterized protein (DUF1778 family)
MTRSTETQSGRLDFRLSPEHKALIERAAHCQGQSVSSFALSTLLRAAHESIQRSTLTTLSPRDSATFLAMLDSDASPNAALKAAVKRYRKRRG